MFVVLEDDAIVRVNPAWTTLTGWSPDETLGRPIRDFFHLHDTDTIRGIGATLRAQGEARSEHRLARKGGGWLWVRSQTKMLPERVRAAKALLIVFQDFTEDLARRIERQQSERANELLRNAAGVYVWQGSTRARGLCLRPGRAHALLAPGRGGDDDRRRDVRLDPRRRPADGLGGVQPHLTTGDHSLLTYRYLDPAHGTWVWMRAAWRACAAPAPRPGT